MRLAPRLPFAEHRNAALALTSRAANGAALLLGQALIARALGPEGMGSYGYALFLATAGSTVATFGLPSAATRFTAEAAGARDDAAAGAVLRAVARWAGLGVLAAVAAAILAGLVLPAALRPPALPGFVLLVVATSARLVAAGAAQGLRDFTGQLRAALYGGLVLPLGAAAVLGLRLGVGAALAATAAHQAAGALLLARRAAPVAARGASLAPAARGRLLRYAASVGVLLVLDAVVWQQSEALFLRAFAPAAELGLYTAAYQLAAQAMTLVPGSFNAALFPALAAQVGAGDALALGRTWRRGMATLAALAVPVAAVGAAAAGPLLALLYGEPFRGGALVLRLVLAAGAVGAVAGGASSLLYARERQVTLLRIGLAASAVNLALDVLLIPRGGATGAALANGLTQVAAAAATFAAAALVLPRAAALAGRDAPRDVSGPP